MPVPLHSLAFANSTQDAAPISQRGLDALPPFGAEVMVLDHEGKITAANEAWRQEHGIPTGQPCVGLTYAAVSARRTRKISADDARTAADGVRRVLAGECKAFSLEYRSHSPTGPRSLFLQVSPCGDTGRGAVVVCQDLTDTQKTEEVSGRKTHPVELAVRGAKLGVWEWDFPSDSITFFEGMGPISGLPPDLRPTTGEAWFARVHPEDRERVSRSFQRAVLGREHYEVEFRMVLPDHSVRWVAVRGQCVCDSAGQPLALTGVDHDITNRKQAENSFRERAVFARLASTVGVAVTRTSDLAIGLDQSAQAIVECLEVALVGVWLVDEKTNQLGFIAGAGELKSLDDPRCQVPVSPIFLRQIVEERRAQTTNQVSDDALISDPQWAIREGIVVFAGFPLMVDERVIGVLGVFARRPWSESEGRGLEEFASTFALFISQRQAVSAPPRREQRLKGIVDSDVDAMITTDVHQKIISFNAAAEKMFGCAVAHVLGQTADLLVPERFRVAPGTLPDAKTAMVWGSRGLRANGEEFPLEAAVSVLDQEGQKLTTIIVHDVSERQRSEHRILQLDRFYSVLSDFNQTLISRPDSQAMFDAACRIAVEQGGFHLAWLGLTAPDAKRVEEVAQAGRSGPYTDKLNLNLEDSSPTRGPVVAAIKNREPVVCNDIEQDPMMTPWRVDSLRLGYRACATFPLEFEGTSLGAFSLYADEVGFFDEYELRLLGELATSIAFVVALNGREMQRRRLEEELAGRSLFLKATVDAAPDGILVVDTQGNHLLQNRRLLELLKFSLPNSPEQEPALRLQDLSSQAKNPEQFSEKIAYLLAQPHATSRDEIELVDGSVVDRYSSPVYHSSGRHYGRIWTFRDLTERRKLEQQLRLAQRMGTIGSLTGGITHDFNNILAAIIGYAELAKMRVKDNPMVSEYLTAVLQGGARAVDLVRNVQAYSQASDQERKPIQLRTVVADPLKLLRASIPSSIEFSLRLATDLPTVWGDSMQIHRVMMDLCTRAWHSMKEVSGRLGVALESVTVDAKMAATESGLRAGPYVRLTISDTGRKNDRTPRDIFYKPYQSTAHSEPGLPGEGITLLEVQNIMEGHSGVILAAIHPELGSSFQLYFPAEVSELAEVATAADVAPSGKGERILFVDDEKPLALLGKKMLEELGYVVECTTNVVEALATVRRQPQGFNLVVTDLTMPGMTGADFAQQLRGIRPNLPIILTTGNSASLTTERVRELGICELLHKPHTVHSLSAAVHRALGQPKLA